MIHMGCIPDGNRRWARERGLSESRGHEIGAGRILDVLKWAFDHDDVTTVSAYLLSEENLQRDQGELDVLFGLLGDFFQDHEVKRLFTGRGIRIQWVTTLPSAIPPATRLKLLAAQWETRFGERTFNALIAYSGRSEILQAIRSPLVVPIVPFAGVARIGHKAIAAGLQVHEPVDVVLRSSVDGRASLSGFLTWQSAYAEIVNVPRHWPDIRREDVDRALDFARNARRPFGR